MITPADLDARFAAWLRDRTAAVPTDGELREFIAALPTEAQRRAARLFARGFLRGYDFCAPIERQRAADDLLAVELRLADLAAFVRLLRAPDPPESTA